MEVKVMKKNKIQFQKGMSIGKFMTKYGMEYKCRIELFQLRWPDGFKCPNCGNNTYCELRVTSCYNAIRVIVRHQLLQEPYFIQPKYH